VAENNIFFVFDMIKELDIKLKFINELDIIFLETLNMSIEFDEVVQKMIK
jgi:hypothetical protein